MSDPLNDLLEEFAEVTAAARLRPPSVTRRRTPTVIAALAASLVVLVAAGVAFVVINSPSPSPAPVAGSSPSIPTTSVEPSASSSSTPTKAPTESPDSEWQEPPAYSFTLVSWCGERALIGTYHVRVQDGKVTSVAPESGHQGRQTMSPVGVPTLADLLSIAADARSRGASDVSLVLARDGHPLFMSVDWRKDTIDDEECYEVKDYVVE
jgi:hypothetical protein